MKTWILLLGMTLAIGSGTAVAATHEHDMPPPKAQAAHGVEGRGVLKAVNSEAGKVKIAHEPIEALGWPAMTMWFALRVPLPEGMSEGDGVRFELEQVDSKEWAITRIERKR